MKVWIGYGSEHSSRLVLIGRFRSVDAARLTEQRFAQLVELSQRQPEPDWETLEEWFDEDTRQALAEIGFNELTPSDLELFRYDHAIRRDDDAVHISTEEADIGGLIKLLLRAGARIDIYSRHDWTDDGEPRSAQAGEETPDA